MIYSGSGSGSSSEFSEFRIQAEVPVPCGYFEIVNKATLNSIIKKNLINYLPFSISYFNPTLHKVQISKRNTFLFIYLSALSYFAGSMRIRIRIHNNV